MKMRSKILLTVTTASVLSLSAVGALAAASGSSDGDSDGAVTVTAFAEPTDDGGAQTVALRGERRGNGGEVAEFLGLTPEELREQLSDGSTLADVATSLGVNPQTLVDYMVGESLLFVPR